MAMKANEPTFLFQYPTPSGGEVHPIHFLLHFDDVERRIALISHIQRAHSILMFY